MHSHSHCSVCWVAAGSGVTCLTQGTMRRIDWKQFGNFDEVHYPTISTDMLEQVETSRFENWNVMHTSVHNVVLSTEHFVIDPAYDCQFSPFDLWFDCSFDLQVPLWVMGKSFRFVVEAGPLVKLIEIIGSPRSLSCGWGSDGVCNDATVARSWLLSAAKLHSWHISSMGYAFGFSLSCSGQGV